MAATPLLAGLAGCEGMACCAHPDTRLTVAMTCCPAPSVSRGPEASIVKERTTAAAKSHASASPAPATATIAAPPAAHTTFATPGSPTTRIRLAHLATLLI